MVPLEEILAPIERGELRVSLVDGHIVISEPDLKEWLARFLESHPAQRARIDFYMDLLPGYRWCATASGESRFPVRGSVSSGAQMYLGTMETALPYCDREFFTDLLAEFRGREVQLGRGFQYPAPPDTLARYVQEHLGTTWNPVGYVAGLLIDEGYAKAVRPDYIRFSNRNYRACHRTVSGVAPA